MGGGITRRLLGAGHRVVAYDRDPAAVLRVEADGAVGVGSPAALAGSLGRPRVVWLMVPAGPPVDEALGGLVPHLQPGDIVVDGGNSYYKDTLRRAAELKARGLHLVDVGTSGGIWGEEAGYCLMVGGDPEPVGHLEPLLRALAAPGGYAHVGPTGAGHFVKMVHNGIEYGLMQAYAEGFELLRAKAEFHLDLGQVASLWLNGSVVRSWLLELTTRILSRNPELAGVSGYVEDSGEGRWTVAESLDLAVPAPVITLALQARFRSRQADSFGARLLAALRREFGGHPVRGSE
jgi:6-phosphogluconate dehydrogenase